MVGRLKFVGLTGGIGSGKSSVARTIRSMGVPVLDADDLARAVVAPGQPAHAEIAATWPEVIGPDRQIDRKKLAARVFSDPAARVRLEAITHPRIHHQAVAEAKKLEEAGHRLAFYEASLLVETGRYRDLDGLVLVTADEEQQIQRVMARDGATRAQVLARLAAQLPLSEKRRAATHVIENSSDEAATDTQVRAMVRSMLAATGPASH